MAGNRDPALFLELTPDLREMDLDSEPFPGGALFAYLKFTQWHNEQHGDSPEALESLVQHTNGNGLIAPPIVLIR